MICTTRTAGPGTPSKVYIHMRVHCRQSLHGVECLCVLVNQRNRTVLTALTNTFCITHWKHQFSRLNLNFSCILILLKT